MAETATELPEVELIENDQFQLPTPTPPQSTRPSPIIGSKAVAVLAVALIVLALAIMSRPEVSQSAAPELPQTTIAPSTTSIPFETDRAERLASATRVTQAIPVFNANLPEDLPGAISAIDAEGSLISIDWSRLRPSENRLQMDLVDDNPVASLAISGAATLDIGRALSISEGQILVSHDDRFLDPGFEVADLAGDPTGSAVVVNYENNGQSVTLVPLDWDGTGETQVTVWDLPSKATEVLGAWQGQLLLHQANRIWLLDADSQPRFVADGELLTYDGRHLARLRCDDLDVCQLLVGTPDAPDTYILDLPETLAPLPHGAWTGSIAIAPDGARLGASVRFGALSLPMVIDLATGETQSLPDGVNRQAPVVWSPDGEWLALVYIDDVLVWNIEQNESWRIDVNRELERLIWH